MNRASDPRWATLPLAALLTSVGALGCQVAPPPATALVDIDAPLPVRSAAPAPPKAATPPRQATAPVPLPAAPAPEPAAPAPEPAAPAPEPTTAAQTDAGALPTAGTPPSPPARPLTETDPFRTDSLDGNRFGRKLVEQILRMPGDEPSDSATPATPNP